VRSRRIVQQQRTQKAPAAERCSRDRSGCRVSLLEQARPWQAGDLSSSSTDTRRSFRLDRRPDFQQSTVRYGANAWFDVRPDIRNRRIAVASRRTEALLERPVFGIERPLSNTRRIRGLCRGDIPIERRRSDTKTLCDLCYGDIGIGQHRLGGLDTIAREFRRMASGAAKTPSGGRPAWVRSRIRLRSNSANAPNM
jgi:hypothetical protein